jgi:hypothetical protein
VAFAWIDGFLHNPKICAEIFMYTKTVVVLSHILHVKHAPNGFAELSAAPYMLADAGEPAGACRLTLSDGSYLLVEEKHMEMIAGALSRGAPSVELDGRVVGPIVPHR